MEAVRVGGQKPPKVDNCYWKHSIRIDYKNKTKMRVISFLFLPHFARKLMLKMMDHQQFFMHAFFLGEDLSDVGIITADIKDHDALMACCEKGSIILNCVGPVSTT